jgi:predicted transcriptional regulator
MWAEQRMSQSAIAREIGLSQPRVRTILLQRFGEEALRARGKPGQRHDLVNA